MKEININPFTKFDKDFALVTAGTKEKFNSMTISWGMLGTIWNEKAVSIYIRPNRYTMEFLKEQDYFTISFFDDKYKKIHKVMGTKSGRDVDKVKETGLIPKYLDKGITYEEADTVLVCKKMYINRLNKESISSEMLSFYQNDGEEDPHFLIIGKVEDII